MQTEPFSRRLELLMDGKLKPEEVLEPLVEGIRNLLKNFEASLEHQPDELIEELGPNLDAIADEAQLCLDLATRALGGDAGRKTLMALAEAHQQLNALLLEFHEASWVFRGPSSIAWVNKCVAAGERFLQGGPLEPGLAYLLDQKSQELTDLLKTRPCLEGQALISAVSRVASWARGTTDPSRQELEDMLTILIGTAEAAEEFLLQQKMSLEQLILTLQEIRDPEEILFCLEMTLSELRLLLDRVDLACLSSSSVTSEAALSVSLTLEAIEQAIHDISEAAHQCEEVDLAEPLLELYEELQERLHVLQEAAQAEGTAPCPFCGVPNSRQARRCYECSRVLAAIAGLETGLFDFIEGNAAHKSEEENVHRLRSACLSFQQGTLEFEHFQGHLHDLAKLLGHAAGAVADLKNGPTPANGLLFQEALVQIEKGLKCLMAVELRADTNIDRGLSLFMEGVEKMREAQNSTVLPP